MKCHFKIYILIIYNFSPLSRFYVYKFLVKFSCFSKNILYCFCTDSRIYIKQNKVMFMSLSFSCSIHRRGVLMPGLGLVRRSQVHLQHHLVVDCRRARKEGHTNKFQTVSSQYHSNQLTASTSFAVKKLASFIRTGTIMIRKNGKANEIFVDLTVHRMASMQTWTAVNKCIFHVGTRFTYGTGG